MNLFGESVWFITEFSSLNHFVIDFTHIKQEDDKIEKCYRKMWKTFRMYEICNECMKFLMNL